MDDKALTGVWRLVRSRPFDASTPEGRDAERHRNALLSIAANVFSKFANLTVLLLSIPLTLSYLGQERFGIWMTLLGIAALLSFADLGIGNALVGETARVAAKGGRRELSVFIADSLIVMCVIGAVIGGGLLLLLNFIPIRTLFNGVDPRLEAEIRWSFLALAVCFSASIPLMSMQRLFAGLQSAHLAHIANGIGSLLSLGLLVWLVRYEASIPWLILATYGLQVGSNAALLPVLARKGLLAPPSAVSTIVARFGSLTRAGSLFLVLQIAAIAGWGVDNLIVSVLIGASEVAVLVVVQRLFEVVVQPLGVANAPLWAAYADASARQDVGFIRRTLVRSLTLTFLAATVLSFVIIMFNETIVASWVGSQVVVPPALAASYGAWIVLASTGSALAMYLNGVGIVKEQVALAIPFTVLSALAKIFAVTEWGIAGIPLATSFVYLGLIVIPYLTFFRKRILAAGGVAT